MTQPRLARLAADLLAEETPLVAERSPEDDARAIFAVEATIRGSARRRRVRRAAVASALAIAATVALLVGWRFVRPGASVEATRTVPAAAATTGLARYHALSDGVVIHRRGGEIALEDGAALESNDRVVTAKTGRLAITLATGTHLVVEGSSDFTIAEQGPLTAFALHAGGVRADVAKLHAGERFLVRTGDSEVEVRGTSFAVAVVPPSSTCGGGTSTRVVVSEGVVVVRHGNREDSVGKGESWPRDCAAAATVLTAATAEKLATATAQSAIPVAPAALVRAAPVAPDAPSDLSAQNAIFAEAAAARRRGDITTAIARYERLTERYPSSPLAENADVERMRLIGASDPRRGADAARAYLARYPRGFARAEANDVIAKQR